MTPGVLPKKFIDEMIFILVTAAAVDPGCINERLAEAVIKIDNKWDSPEKEKTPNSTFDLLGVLRLEVFEQNPKQAFKGKSWRARLLWKMTTPIYALLRKLGPDGEAKGLMEEFYRSKNRQSQWGIEN